LRIGHAGHAAIQAVEHHGHEDGDGGVVELEVHGHHDGVETAEQRRRREGVGQQVDAARAPPCHYLPGLVQLRGLGRRRDFGKGMPALALRRRNVGIDVQ
jgi:hypothetical protein